MHTKQVQMPNLMWRNIGDYRVADRILDEVATELRFDLEGRAVAIVRLLVRQEEQCCGELKNEAQFRSIVKKALVALQDFTTKLFVFS